MLESGVAILATVFHVSVSETFLDFYFFIESSDNVVTSTTFKRSNTRGPGYNNKATFYFAGTKPASRRSITILEVIRSETRQHLPSLCAMDRNRMPFFLVLVAVLGLLGETLLSHACNPEMFLNPKQKGDAGVDKNTFLRHPPWSVVLSPTTAHFVCQHSPILPGQRFSSSSNSIYIAAACTLINPCNHHV